MRWILAIAVTVVLLVLAVVVGVLSSQSVGPGARAPSEIGPEVSAADGSRYRGGNAPPGQRLPRFSLADYEGRTVTPQDLRGRVVLVTFLDTQCTDACPLIASVIGSALRRIPSETRREIVALAVSSDPEGDTPESVREFLKRHRAEGDLRYLVGDPAQLRPVWDAFHVLASHDSGDDDIHSASVRIFDSGGAWVTSLHPGADLTTDNLIHDLVQALESR